MPAPTAAASMIDLSMPTRTVPSVPPSMGTPMSMISRSPRCRVRYGDAPGPAAGRLPGTRFFSMRPAGTRGENVWAISVRWGSYTMT